MSKFTKQGQVCATTLIPNILWVTNTSYDYPDLRLPLSKSLSQQRSINLAISSRGIAALQAIDPAATERFMQSVIPMRGRMIHDKQGKLDSQLYDMDGQVGVFIIILSIPYVCP